MRRKKILSLPRLNNRGESLNKDWYVEVGMRNPKNDEWERKRFSELRENSLNINCKTTIEERYEESQKIINILNYKIRQGWTLFNDVESCIYEDQLQYSHEAVIFKKNVSSNTNYNYWIGEYIKESFVDLKPETKSTYKSRYRIFGLWLKSQNLGELDITAIDNSVILRFFEYLKTNRDQSSRTYRSYADLIRAFFDNLTNKSIIAKNPVFNLPKNRRVKDEGAERIPQTLLKPLMKVLDEEDSQLALACRFEYYCGLRPGYEIRLLKICDIDFRRGYSKVRVCLNNAKTTRRREVAIPDVFLEYLLEKGIDKYPSDYYVIGKGNRPSSKHLGKNNLRFRFVKFRKQLNLSTDYKLYSMKHTGAVVLAEEGERIINIRDHLGHSSIATTEAYLKRHGYNESKIIRSMFPEI